MEFKIEWHEECLKNSKNYLENRKRELEFLMASIADQEKRNDFYGLQIDTAKAKRMTEFDSTKFMVLKRASEGIK